MRTTLDIADDVLFAAKELAQRDKISVGTVVSELTRLAFAHSLASTGPRSIAGSGKTTHVAEPLAAYGIQPLPAHGGIVSNELMDRLRDAQALLRNGA